MRTFVVGALLVFAIAQPSLAQVVRCELAVYHVSYGLGGRCVTEAVSASGEQTRTSATRFWPKESVSIFMAGGPSSSSPVAGLFYQSEWHDPFQLDLDRMELKDKGRLIIRTSGAIMLVDEWKQLSRDVVSLVFRLHFAPATRNDVAILQTVLAKFNTDTNWNRAGSQNCENEAPSGESLFCVLQAAVKAQFGRYHHAQPAVDLLRALIRERYRARYSGHILVDFNNHAETTIDDIRTLLESAIVGARAEAGSR